MAQQYRVTGLSGQTEVIEAEGPIAANGIYAEHHGEPARTTVQVQTAVITERDTSDV